MRSFSGALGQSQRTCSEAFLAAIVEVIHVHERELIASRCEAQNDENGFDLAVPRERELLQKDVDTHPSMVDLQSILLHVLQTEKLVNQAHSYPEHANLHQRQQRPRSILSAKRRQNRAALIIDAETNQDTSLNHEETLDAEPLQRNSRSSKASRASSSDSELKMWVPANDDMEAFYERDFEVRKMWDHANVVEKETQQLKLAQKSVYLTKVLTYRQLDPDYAYVEQGRGFAVHLMASPAAPRRVVWELLGILLVFYDLIMIPMVTAFDPPGSIVFDVLDWVQLIYWPINVPVLLTTGFIQNGTLYLTPKKILMRYMKRWMTIDLLTILPDWFFLLSSHFSESSDDSSNAAFVRLLRIVRLMRLARLLRLMKLRNAWNMIYDMIDSEKVGIVLELLKMVVVLMVVNHYVACFWFAIGKNSIGKSWLSETGFSHELWSHQYVVSFHWSITQFTPASMDIQAENAKERVFAVIVVIFALVGFSYLVGSITGSLTRLRAMGEEKNNNFWLLRRFLKKNRVPKELSMRIKSYAESMWDHQQSDTREDNVLVLALLSDHLRAELRCAICGPALRVHPLFDRLHVDSPVTLRRLASQGIEALSLAPLDVLFAAGEEATHMSILTDGRMEYQRIYNQTEHPEVVDAKEDWIAEHCIWVNAWVHLGDIKAVLASELLQLSPEAWFQLASLNPVAFRLSTSYAMRYTEWLNQTEKENLSDVTQGENQHLELRQFIDPPLHESEHESGSGHSPRSSFSKVRSVFKGWMA